MPMGSRKPPKRPAKKSPSRKEGKPAKKKAKKKGGLINENQRKQLRELGYL